VGGGVASADTYDPPPEVAISWDRSTLQLSAAERDVWVTVTLRLHQGGSLDVEWAEEVVVVRAQESVTITPDWPRVEVRDEAREFPGTVCGYYSVTDGEGRTLQPTLAIPDADFSSTHEGGLEISTVPLSEVVARSIVLADDEVVATVSPTEVRP
jgi:hypothetical protein